MACVLIVEDDQDFCESLMRFLSAVGHMPICEGDGRAGLQSLLQHDPDVILLDLRLPVMDGLAFLKVARSYIRFRSTPIFVMTGVSDDEKLTEAQDAGANQIFRKGVFEFADLRKAIEGLPLN